MKHLELKNPEYKLLEEQFHEWLQLLNFEQSTVKYAPLKAREFLHWLENNNINRIEAVNKQVIANYFDYLQSRQNRRKNGWLSHNYLRSHLTAIRKLSRYLRETGQASFETDIYIQGTRKTSIHVFTKQEIKKLYQACEENVLGIRDKAMLSVYYGCGLRRNEGINLDITDLYFDKNLLYVRKGKNYKERYVPMSPGVKEDLQDYVNYARAVLDKKSSNALFLNRSGKRMISGSMAVQLQKLKVKAGIEKEGGLHCLRHSIATHLLQSGMELEQIRLFLGHSSLETTQIYVHLSAETE